MNNIVFAGKKVTLSDNFKQKATEKLSKLDKFFSRESTAYVTLSTLREMFVAEITVKHANMIFRAEKLHHDKYESLDDAINTIVRQIRKNKTQLLKKHHDISDDAFLNFSDTINEDTHKVVKYKRFSFKPISVEEAILQMELLGHSFFVFRNAEDDEINVVYKRKDGDYAVLESEI